MAGHANGILPVRAKVKLRQPSAEAGGRAATYKRCIVSGDKVGNVLSLGQNLVAPATDPIPFLPGQLNPSARYTWLSSSLEQRQAIFLRSYGDAAYRQSSRD